MGTSSLQRFANTITVVVVAITLLKLFGGTRAFELARRFAAIVASVLRKKHVPRFYMIMGIPGSGKSFWAQKFSDKRIVNGLTTVIVSTDAIREELFGDINAQHSNDAVWITAVDRVVSGLNGGHDVILDATNTNTVKRRQFIAALPPCKRFIKVMHVAKNVAMKRIKADIEGGVHRSNVPESVVEKMNGELHRSLHDIQAEGWQLLRGRVQ
jgi:predicted kinase